LESPKALVEFQTDRLAVTARFQTEENDYGCKKPAHSVAVIDITSACVCFTSRTVILPCRLRRVARRMGTATGSRECVPDAPSTSLRAKRSNPASVKRQRRRCGRFDSNVNRRYVFQTADTRLHSRGVIACDKRKAFAQGSTCDDCVRRSPQGEGGSNPFFALLEWIASLRSQ
jgi:hypothetical protein